MKSAFHISIVIGNSEEASRKALETTSWLAQNYFPKRHLLAYLPDDVFEKRQ